MQKPFSAGLGRGCIFPRVLTPTLKSGAKSDVASVSNILNMVIEK